MPTTFHTTLRGISDDLHRQGRLVLQSVEDAVEAVFERRESKAREVIGRDEQIDRDDVRIEKAAVQLLVDEWGHEGVGAADVRAVMTVVKVNNELERIGDLSVAMAERVGALSSSGVALSPRFRVMANSVIGIMRDTNTALEKMDTQAAQRVLAFDDATEQFRTAILRELEEGLVKGVHTVDFSFAANRVAHCLARIADHCTNVAEQVIYVATGKIVRHQGEHWTRPEDPGA